MMKSIKMLFFLVQSILHDRLFNSPRILVLGEGPTHRLNDFAITAEAKYSEGS